MSYVEQAERDRMAAQLRGLQDQFARLQRERGGAEVDAMKRAQVRADAVMALFGKQARDPSLGETPLEYRRALVGELAEHSPKYKNANLRGYDAQSISAAGDVVFADAQVAAHNANQAVGKLVAYKERDPAGRVITKWYGDPMVWMSQFMTGGQVGHVIRPRGKAPGS